MAKIVERIALIIKEKGVSVRSFEMQIGASNGAIGRAISKGTDITAEWLSKIIETNPEISSDWLLAGRGSMLRSDEPPPTPEPKVIYQSDPRDAQLIAALQTTIERDADVITALKRELQEYKDREGRPVEKGFQPQHLGGAQSVDIPTSK